MTRAETMARWHGANVSCCDPFHYVEMPRSPMYQANAIALAAAVIAAIEVLPAEQRAGVLATDVKLRAAITCGCEDFRADPWPDIEPVAQQHLRVTAARWLGALEAA